MCSASALVGDMFDRVRVAHGFEVATDHLVLFGYCARCRDEDGGARG